MLNLYSYFRSSASYRVRIALNLKGVSWETIPVNLLKSEQSGEAFLEKNEQGLVPALDIGGTVLNQSMAIIEYLDETYPDPPLLPDSSVARANVRALAYQVAMDIHPLNNLRVLSMLTGTLNHSEEEKIDWIHHWIGVGFKSLESSLEQVGSNGQFCFGDSVTLADLCLIPQVYNARRFKAPMDDYTLINSIVEHCNQIDAFKAAEPASQPDSTI